MRGFRRWLPIVGACLCASAAAGQSPERPTAAEAARWLDGFRDGVSHWQKQHDQTDYPRHAPDQVAAIADNLLLYQRANGGWPKDLDMIRILSAEEKAAIAAERAKTDTSFDNRNTYTQVEYLARAFTFTGDKRYRDAALAGLEFILAAQYANGGWPHTYPNRKGYYPRITMLDDIMTGLLTTLGKVAKGAEPFAFVDEPMRARCREAVTRGNDLLLTLQVRVRNTRTGWAPQYDEVTLEPCVGRTFELPSIVGRESVEILRYLMTIEDPSDEIRQAIEAGAAWLERSKLTGFRLERVPAPTVRYEHHTSRDDIVVVADPEAPALWARFYEIDTNRPFLCNRDGIKVYRLEDLHRERRTGANWFGPYATEFLKTEYPAWRQRWQKPSSE